MQLEMWTGQNLWRLYSALGGLQIKLVRRFNNYKLIIFVIKVMSELR